MWVQVPPMSREYFSPYLNYIRLHYCSSAVWANSIISLYVCVSVCLCVNHAILHGDFRKSPVETTELSHEILPIQDNFPQTVPQDIPFEHYPKCQPSVTGHGLLVHPPIDVVVFSIICICLSVCMYMYVSIVLSLVIYTVLLSVSKALICKVHFGTQVHLHNIYSSSLSMNVTRVFLVF